MSQIPVPSEDLYLYSMRLLDAQESRGVEQLLRESPEAQAELIQIRGDLAFLAFSVEPQPVPNTARNRFLNSIAEQREAQTHDFAGQVARQDQPARIANGTSNGFAQQAAFPTAAQQAPRMGQIYDSEPKGSLLSQFLPWLGWAVAAGLAVSTWTFHERSTAMQDQVVEARENAARAAAAADRAVADSARATAVLETLGSRSAQRFMLTRQNTTPAPSARVTYVASTGSLVFQGNNLEMVPLQKTYELWLIPSDKAAKPIPAGTFTPDTRGFASLILPALPRGITAATFGITMEDAGGSETPTLPILLIGA